MGLAASQARLLSITSRLAKNELMSQSINNAKMRLASQSSKASQDYIQALNDAEYNYTTYDNCGMAVTNALNFNNLCGYSSYNNQYAVINNANQILVNEDQAIAFKNANHDLNKFLNGLGFEYKTNYFDEIGALINENYPEPFDFISTNELENYYNEYVANVNSVELAEFNKISQSYNAAYDELVEIAAKNIDSYLFSKTLGIQGVNSFEAFQACSGDVNGIARIVNALYCTRDANGNVKSGNIFANGETDYNWHGFPGHFSESSTNHTAPTSNLTSYINANDLNDGGKSSAVYTVDDVNLQDRLSTLYDKIYNNINSNIVREDEKIEFSEATDFKDGLTQGKTLVNGLENCYYTSKEFDSTASDSPWRYNNRTNSYVYSLEGQDLVTINSDGSAVFSPLKISTENKTGYQTYVVLLNDSYYEVSVEDPDSKNPQTVVKKYSSYNTDDVYEEAYKGCNDKKYPEDADFKNVSHRESTTFVDRYDVTNGTSSAKVYDTGISDFTKDNFFDNTIGIIYRGDMDTTSETKYDSGIHKTRFTMQRSDPYSGQYKEWSVDYYNPVMSSNPGTTDSWSAIVNSWDIEIYKDGKMYNSLGTVNTYMNNIVVPGKDEGPSWNSRGHQDDYENPELGKDADNVDDERDEALKDEIANYFTEYAHCEKHEHSSFNRYIYTNLTRESGAPDYDPVTGTTSFYAKRRISHGGKRDEIVCYKIVVDDKSNISIYADQYKIGKNTLGVVTGCDEEYADTEAEEMKSNFAGKNSSWLASHQVSIDEFKSYFGGEGEKFFTAIRDYLDMEEHYNGQEYKSPNGEISLDHIYEGESDTMDLHWIRTIGDRSATDYEGGATAAVDMINQLVISIRQDLLSDPFKAMQALINMGIVSGDDKRICNQFEVQKQKLMNFIFGEGITENITEVPSIEDLQNPDYILTYSKTKKVDPNGEDVLGNHLTTEYKTVVKTYVTEKMIEEYGEPNYTWVDTKDPSNTGNSEAIVKWYTNLFNRMEKGYAVLEDGLASSKDWMKYALQTGLVCLEQATSNYQWSGLDYKGCKDIVENVDETAVAKAEAEYNRVMNDIKAKDNIFDIELKNIDTQHNSLQTEYESISKLINKNIERTFKLKA